MKLFDGYENVISEGSSFHSTIRRKNDFKNIRFENHYLGREDLSSKDFGGSRFRYCDLNNVSFRNCDMTGVHFLFCDLSNADFTDARLYGTHFFHCDLDGAKLKAASKPKHDHAFIAELLFQAAEENMMRRSLAGLIAISPDWCWREFVRSGHPEVRWALEVLSDIKVRGARDYLENL